jgi:hypothetical protein
MRAYIALPVFLCALGLGPAKASTVFDSLSYLLSNSYTGAGTGFHVTNTNTYGAEFLSNSVQQYLNLVEVAVVAISANQSDTISAYLYSNTGTGTSSKPNTQLFQIGTAQSPGTTSDTTLTFTATPNSITLQPSTEYWIVLHDNGVNGHYVDWLTVAGTSHTTGASGQYFDSHSSTFPGGTWATATDNGHNGSGAVFAMEVTTTDVSSTPEPISMMLVGAPLVGLAVFARRRMAR